MTQGTEISPNTSPKPFVFVLMPFAPEFKDTYELAIKAACERAGAYCERVDEQQYHENMVERIYNQISKADFIIADMTGKNPNVFYEVGYAHALDKLVVLVTKMDSDIPFDLKQMRHIVYSSNTQLRDELEKSVRWCIENPKKATVQSKRRLDVFVSGELVEGNPAFQITGIPKGINDGGQVTLEVSIHNVPEKRIAIESFQFGVETPKDLLIRAGNRDQNSFSVSEKSNLTIIERKFTILPDSWLKVVINLEWPKDWTQFGVEFPFAFKFFSDEGTLTFPFRVTFKDYM